MEGKVVDNKFLIGEHVGKGGFSNVYKAFLLPQDGLITKDRAPQNLCSEDCKYVIKIAKDRVYCFKNEYLVTQNIKDCKGCIRYLEHGKIQLDSSQDETYDYLISEYLPNGELFHHVSKKGVPETVLRHLFGCLLDALESLHSSGYAHMDIKLSNILLNSECVPLLSDFGLSIRICDDQQLEGSEYCWKGSSKYKAPEILLQDKFCPKKADVFSLAVCFFVLAFGCYPFKKATLEDKKYKYMINVRPDKFIKKHPKAKKKIKNCSISPEFVELVISMLASDPNQRPTINEIRECAWLNTKELSPALSIKEYFNN